VSPQTVHRPPLPSEITSTTIDHGVTTLYVAYREVGAADRGIYDLALLCEPSPAMTTTARQLLWNSKLWICAYGGWSSFWSQSSFGLGQIDPDPTNRPPPVAAMLEMTVKNAAAFHPVPTPPCSMARVCAAVT
jgi:hypothetical protein